MAKLVAVVITLISLSSALVVRSYGGPHEFANAPQRDEYGNGTNQEAKLVQVTIAPVGTDTFTRKDQFKAGEPVHVLLSLTNTGTEPLTVIVGDPLLQQRLKLSKDGKPVLYKKQILGLIRSKEKHGSGPGSVQTVHLQPKRATRISYFDLRDLFGQLEPGHYQLTLRHRLQGKGKAIESNAIAFDISQ